VDKRILWIIPKWTFPINDGARVATDSLIRTTIAAGAKVDVLCLPQAFEKINLAEMRDHWKVNEIFVMPRTLPAKKWAKVIFYFLKFIKQPFFPLTLSSFADDHLRFETRKLIKKIGYQQVVLDGLHLGALFVDGSRWRAPGPQVILRAHNIETDLWKRAAEEKQNPLFRWVLNWQKNCVAKIEQIIAGSVAGIAAISEEDGESFKQIAPKTPLKVIPLGLNFARPLSQPELSGINFLFIGRLDWAPNRDGLEWILRDVWPQVYARRPKAQLQIVGSGDRSWLASYAQLPGVELIGFVKDIRDAYEKCHFTITPLTYGSGTRIKVVESFAMNRALISTRMGVQGAYLEDADYISAETTEEWIDILSTVEWNENSAKRLKDARQKIAGILDESQIGRSFYDWLKTFE
jgi:glycosyltransferase involved in cell wall biosynthesis